MNICFENYCYDSFSIFIKFSSSEKILKMRCQTYILMKKVIILRKIHVSIKCFAPPFFNHFSLHLNRKKCAVMRAIKTKLIIFTLQLLIYYILE